MSLIETITLIAMVLVAGGVSSRLVELIKSALERPLQDAGLVKHLLRNHGYPLDKQEHATQLVLAQAEEVC